MYNFRTERPVLVCSQISFFSPCSPHEKDCRGAHWRERKRDQHPGPHVDGNTPVFSLSLFRNICVNHSLPITSANHTTGGGNTPQWALNTFRYLTVQSFLVTISVVDYRPSSTVVKKNWVRCMARIGRLRNLRGESHRLPLSRGLQRRKYK